jgi:hypothetical protein
MINATTDMPALFNFDKWKFYVNDISTLAHRNLSLTQVNLWKHNSKICANISINGVQGKHTNPIFLIFHKRK